MISQAVLDRTFAELESAAATGARCPQSYPYGNLSRTAPGLLARAGRIRIEIFMHNWRVVTIMEGPHKGKQTAAPKGANNLRPYKVIYKDHIYVRQNFG